MGVTEVAYTQLSAKVRGRSQRKCLVRVGDGVADCLLEIVRSEAHLVLYDEVMAGTASTLQRLVCLQPEVEELWESDGSVIDDQAWLEVLRPTVD